MNDETSGIPARAWVIGLSICTLLWVLIAGAVWGITKLLDTL